MIPPPPASLARGLIILLLPAIWIWSLGTLHYSIQAADRANEIKSSCDLPERTP